MTKQPLYYPASPDATRVEFHTAALGLVGISADGSVDYHEATGTEVAGVTEDGDEVLNVLTAQRTDKTGGVLVGCAEAEGLVARGVLAREKAKAQAKADDSKKEE